MLILAKGHRSWTGLMKRRFGVVRIVRRWIKVWRVVLMVFLLIGIRWKVRSLTTRLFNCRRRSKSLVDDNDNNDNNDNIKIYYTLWYR